MQRPLSVIYGDIKASKEVNFTVQQASDGKVSVSVAPFHRALHLGTSARQIAISEFCRAASGTLAFTQPTHSIPCSEQDRAAAVSIEARPSIPINKNIENRNIPPLRYRNFAKFRLTETCLQVEQIQALQIADVLLMRHCIFQTKPTAGVL
jgi:hypothetical protein